MNRLLRSRLAQAHRLYGDLLENLTPEQLASRLAALPSNSIGSQLWCVLGARESFPRAARAGAWQGFGCSLEEDSMADASAVRAAFDQSALDLDAWVSEIDADDEGQLRYALALLEHETMHHGQLIRYLYGLGIARPASWQQVYALDGQGA